MFLDILSIVFTKEQLEIYIFSQHSMPVFLNLHQSICSLVGGWIKKEFKGLTYYLLSSKPPPHTHTQKIITLNTSDLVTVLSPVHKISLYLIKVNILNESSIQIMWIPLPFPLIKGLWLIYVHYIQQNQTDVIIGTSFNFWTRIKMNAY